MKQLYTLFIFLLSTFIFAQDMKIVGTLHGSLTGSTPNMIALYAINDIADLSDFGLGVANEGEGTDNEEYSFPAVSVLAGAIIYIASEETGFTSFFGYAPEYVDAVIDVDGNDAIELFESGVVIDVFGDINVDGTGEIWEYTQGWVVRKFGTGPDGTIFDPGNWDFSGIDVLFGDTENFSDSNAHPFGVPTDLIIGEDIFINEIHYDSSLGTIEEGFEIAGPAGTDLKSFKMVLYDGSDGTYYSFESIKGQIPDQESGFGTIWYPVSDLKISDLIDPEGGLYFTAANSKTTWDFVSYGGSFTALNGWGIGTTSIDTGVVGNPPITGVDDTLQLVNLNGAVRSDFMWNNTPILETFDNINTGQSFGGTASIGENEIESFVTYPNPVLNGYFTIQSRRNLSKSVEIYDVLGKQVYNKQILSREKVSVTNLSKGIYTLRVDEDGKTATRKLIIE